jgi:hypothetical protein
MEIEISTSTPVHSGNYSFANNMKPTYTGDSQR